MTDAPQPLKKQLELLACQNVALEINKTEGTDFQVKPGEREPADVDFVSQSGRYPRRAAQVVSIPRDIQHREDNQNIERLRRELAVALADQGLMDLLVGLILGPPGHQYGLKTDLVERLARLIHRTGAPANYKLDYGDILDSVPEAAVSVHQIIVSSLPGLGRIEVEVPIGGALPRDGRWIAEGIISKLGRYGGREGVKDLTLVIDARGFVDQDQIEAFQRNVRPEDMPFAEVWITGSFAGTVALKRRVTLGAGS